MAEWNLFYCGSNQSPFRVEKIIFWKYFWEVIYIRATAGIKQFCLLSERSTIALKSNFLGNGWMKFFQMWLKSKVFWHKKNDLLSPWWKNHFPLSHSWIYKFCLITVRYWKMLILRTTEIHFRTLVSLPKENMFHFQPNPMCRWASTRLSIYPGLHHFASILDINEPILAS